MRRLIYIPIIHTEADMGSLAGSLKEAYQRSYGEEGWTMRVKAIDQMWSGIKRRLDALPLDYAKTRLYQDGLPICGKELQIVTEVAGRGSPNHGILLDLVKKGGLLMGTESSKLLLEEYRNIKQALIKGPLWKRAWQQALGHWILYRRDRFIARQIAKTLQAGETGVLFLGIHHRVDRYLPNGISTQYLFHRLPFELTRRFAPKV